MVEMRVRGLAIEARSRSPIVILTDLQETRFLPIWIGVYEADAILLAQENIAAPRPTTHELFRSVLGGVGVELERIVVHSVDEKSGTFYAKLMLKVPGEAGIVEIDARPSDSIALALRCGAPIFVSEAVLSQPSVVTNKEKVNKDIEEFKKFLADVKPGDFERYDRLHEKDEPGEDEGKGGEGKKA